MWLGDLLQGIYNLLSNPSFAAISGAAITGIGVQVIANRSKNKVIKIDESTAMRVELRAEIDILRNKLEKKEIDLDKWRNDYYHLLNQYNEAMNRARIAEEDLKDALREITRLKPPS